MAVTVISARRRPRPARSARPAPETPRLSTSSTDALQKEVTPRRSPSTTKGRKSTAEAGQKAWMTCGAGEERTIPALERSDLI
ncbi:unnamed protein product [Menidia menidia]|uniref:(Atlantic silverside) hypothetical protein n=1 Tax=Menidia menidia TaxID=238744 RepID=A0A8S4BSZ0_9TELE|nr:unnamed protein product [Menidia menidia]